MMMHAVFLGQIIYLSARRWVLAVAASELSLTARHPWFWTPKMGRSCSIWLLSGMSGEPDVQIQGDGLYRFRIECLTPCEGIRIMTPNISDVFNTNSGTFFAFS
jgi:hypothetical protein